MQRGKNQEVEKCYYQFEYNLRTVHNVSIQNSLFNSEQYLNTTKTVFIYLNTRPMNS